jgi:CubicO group peptidase (beta-lactamase class C family)
VSDGSPPIALAERSFDEITHDALESGYFAGSVFRVEHRGGLLFEKAWGLSLDTPDDKRPMTASCSFDIASITKLFTTTAILRLVTLGRLRLDDRFCDMLGWHGTRLGAMLGRIDMKAALAHSTGLHYWYPFYTRKSEPFEAILESVIDEHPLRNEVIYSDLNFMLLGKVVSTIGGLPLGGAMANLVFAPLGLARSSFGRPIGEAAATEWGNRIEMGMVREAELRFEGWRDTEVPIHGSPDDGNCHYYFGGEAGQAGIFSDARDLCALGRLYLDDGRIESRVEGRAGDAYLDPALAREACKDQGGGRGMGFQFGENYPCSGFGHGGFTGTYLYLNREAGIVAAILTNRLHVASPRKVGDYMQGMIRATLDSPYRPYSH